MTTASLASSRSSSIADMIQCITQSGRITRSDQQQLMNALLSQQTIGSDEQQMIDQVFDLLKAGRLRVVD